MFVYVVLSTKWGNRHVLHRQKHISAVESRKPLTIVTSVSPQKSLELISELLPDHKAEAGAIQILASKGNRLDFGVHRGSVTVLANRAGVANRATTLICKFSVVAAGYTENNEHKTAIRLVTTWWIENTGVFHDYKKLIEAQDKLTAIIQEAILMHRYFMGMPSTTKRRMYNLITNR